MINGYKQIIGLVILGLGSAINTAGYPDMGQPLVEAGGVIAGIGALHQGYKRQRE
jgi:hypothetical protein